MIFDEISLCIVLVESAKECSKLKSFVSIGDVLEQDVLSVLFEDVECEVNGEKIANFFLEAIPHFPLHVG